MFGTAKEAKKEEKQQAKVDYNVTVTAARATKNEKIVMFDMNVNGVDIKSCMLKEVEVKKDGEKYKKGDICYLVQFPAGKSGDKYYNRVWFPISAELNQQIVDQIRSLLT